MVGSKLSHIDVKDLISLSYRAFKTSHSAEYECVPLDIEMQLLRSIINHESLIPGAGDAIEKMINTAKRRSKCGPSFVPVIAAKFYRYERPSVNWK